MTDTIITVRGHASAEHEAERATVNVSVAHEGARRDSVFAATTAVAAAVTRPLAGSKDEDAGPVVAWSSERVAVWSHRPTNNGKLLAPMYHASIGVRATFIDFDALARWVEELATTEGVSVGWIQWELHDETRDRLLEQIATQAVQDAAAKALVYARAAGFPSVSALAIADPGMLGSGEGNGRGVGLMMADAPMAARAQHGGRTELSFTPESIEISAHVDARFLAG